MNKALPVLIVLAIFGGLVWFARSQPVVETTPTPTVEEVAGPTDSEQTSIAVDEPNPAAQAEVREFTVVGRNFEYDTSEIRVKQGETVRIVFKNEEGTHDWVVDEFNVRSALIQSGKETTVDFVADKKGEFEYYCSVGQHRQMGMKGLLIVE